MCSFIYFYNFNALLPKADELHLDGLLADSSFSKTIPPKFEFCNVAIIKNTTLMTGTDSMNRSTSCWRARRGSACGVFVGQCSDSQLIMSEIERYTKHATAMKLQQLHEGCNGFQPPFSDEDIATKINAIRLMVAQIQCQQPFYFHSIAITDSIPVAFAFLLLLTFSFLSLVVTFGFLQQEEEMDSNMDSKKLTRGAGFRDPEECNRVSSDEGLGRIFNRLCCDFQLVHHFRKTSSHVVRTHMRILKGEPTGKVNTMLNRCRSVIHLVSFFTK